MPTSHCPFPEAPPLHLLDRIPNKRAFLARLLGASGVPTLLERLNRRRRPGLAVLTYHRIAEPGVGSDPYYDPVISATPASFAAQMKFLRRHFAPVSLERVWEPDVVAATVSTSGKSPALVTFDDGYRDNFEAALPILREFGIPAAFFIPTGFLDRPELPWWDHVAYVLKRTRVERLALERRPGDVEPVTILLGSSPDDRTRVAAIRRVIGLFLEKAIPDERRFLARLGEQAEVDVDSPALGAGLFMGFRELRALTASGMAIGSHGHSHRALGTLGPEEQRRELEESKRILESGLGREVLAVAYPYGWAGAFTPETERLAAEAGYRLGFSSLEGVNAASRCEDERFRLRRLNVGTGDSGPLLRARAALHGAFGRSFL